MPVLGVDACRTGWVGIIVAAETRHVLAVWGATVDELVSAAGEIDMVAIDIPIGLPDHGPRRCDVEARAHVGPRRNSVFMTPCRAVVEAATYAEANAMSRELAGHGVSQQAYALRRKILEVDHWMSEAPCDVREVHPEVSFRKLNDEPLPTAKTTWAGMHLRRGLLERAGITLDSNLGRPGEMAAVDDVLDAAVAAWSALRIVSGDAISLPDPPPLDARGRPVAIWA